MKKKKKTIPIYEQNNYTIEDVRNEIPCTLWNRTDCVRQKLRLPPPSPNKKALRRALWTIFATESYDFVQYNIVFVCP